ncbi:hypothetical protein [Microbispora bryophytorum]|uniref:Uncharacterized protein n=1 Tax=Microbispora bryophytorum TaxID=1460882 RepID=A0A8H9LAY4_9ACTN|nr:hypothetical protein [Microbispora bryophytorum]MBD3135168.1 hypothetical protein [Microbispora bryophytorum]TQS08612.1 hypothetical protein FLX07_04935 [Microbispora bryophytorum]GGO10327.1 hypothetical protein GCM10011574_26700 [Microbispora bryophytorum]
MNLQIGALEILNEDAEQRAAATSSSRDRGALRARRRMQIVAVVGRPQTLTQKAPVRKFPDRRLVAMINR